MEDLKIEQKFVVSWGKGMQVVPNQKLVEGVPYLCLAKWDRTSVRLLSGKALDLRKQKRDQSGNLHSSAWDELLELRQQRANVLLQDALKEDEENHQSKKGKPVRAQSKHAVMLPLTMEVDFFGQKMNILLEGLGSQSIWVELNEQNILFLHEKCSSTEEKPCKKAKKAKKAKKQQDDDDGGDHDKVDEGEGEEE